MNSSMQNENSAQRAHPAMVSGAIGAIVDNVEGKTKPPRAPRRRSLKAVATPIAPALQMAADTPVPADTPLHKAGEGLNGPDPILMKKQAGWVARLMDYYFRLEIGGWENLPQQPALLIGVHSGGPLTMDAWTIAYAWWRHFEGARTLHGTAHDFLMNTPLLGRYFRRMGAIAPTRENIQASLARGDDVILWPGGEKDAFRRWDLRDKAVLGERSGFIRLAIRTGAPIVPVATVGGHDTLFVLSEGRWLAKLLNLKKYLRSDVAPITLSWPLGVALHLTPLQHIPLPAKIRTEFLAAIRFDVDPAMADDADYVKKMYAEVERRIQAGMDALARKRKFPVFA